MAFTEIDEKLLVRAYQAGDDRAFDTIVRTQYNALYAHAYSRLSNHEAAEDAVQDTLLRAYRALAKLDGDLALKAWLHRILTNVCHDEGNRRRRQQGLVEKIGALPEELAGDPAEEAALYDTVRIMSEALEELPESYREALVLRYVDGLSFREVAEASGVTEENARARVHRGRLALHKIMARVAIIVAFLVPGLKRTQAATSAEHAAAPGISEQTVSLTTQLTSHVVNAAPTVSRFAELSSSLPGGKSALAAAAVTAVAAVAAPVAYTVNEARQPERPPASYAAPAEPATTTTAPGASAAARPSKPSASDSPTATSASAPATAVAPTTSTSTTLPPSLANPFGGASDSPVATTVPRKQDAPAATTTTTAPPTSSTTQPPEQGRVLEGRISAPTARVVGTAPQLDLDGDIVLTVGSKSMAGTLAGRIYVQDDGSATSDGLRLTLDGRTLNLRFRGKQVTTEQDGATTYALTGDYALKDGASVGLAEAGQLAGVLRVLDGGTGSLTLDLRGRERS